MAQVDFLLQAITPVTHASELIKIFKTPESKKILLSVAFAQELGVDALANEIRKVAKKTKVYVGIRNEITSIQAINLLLSLGVRVYAVDTAARSPIFHPKLYVVQSDSIAKVVIGSANLTFSGLHNNIEASAILTLDMANNSDKKFVGAIQKSMDSLSTDFPEHVFRILNRKHAKELFDSGRLADEELALPPVTRSRIKTKERDPLKRMKLHQTRPAKRRPSTKAKTKKKTSKKSSGTVIPKGAYKLLWTSKALTERDLNIPKSQGTNPTGSMGWKKGAQEGIDQRHYFRDEVFADLIWIPEKKSSWERATGKFEISIKNISYGPHNLKLSHNTDKSSASYKQKNFMTQLHWGSIRPAIAKKDLLGRTLRLYKKASDPPEYLIEID